MRKVNWPYVLLASALLIFGLGGIDGWRSGLTVLNVLLGAIFLQASGALR